MPATLERHVMPKSAENGDAQSHMERATLRVPNGYQLGRYKRIEPGDTYLRPDGYAAIAGVHTGGYGFTLEMTPSWRRKVEAAMEATRQRLAAQ